MLLTFIENFENYLNNIGINNDFGLVFFGMVLLVGGMVLFSLLNAPKMLIYLSGIIMSFMFMTFGWFPAWVGFVIAVIVFLLAYISITKGGSIV